MANVKNFGLSGVGSDLQLGKAGTRLVNNSGTFNFKAADGSTDAALLAAGITSSAGNVTLTTGNVNLQSNSATIGYTDATLAREASGVLKFSGTSAFVAPVGSTAARPSAATGMVRVNNDTPTAATVEFYNGTAWTTLASGGNTALLQTEIDNIEAALGAAIDSDGNFVPGGFTGSAAGATSFTDAIQQVADAAAGKDTLDELFPSLAAGNVIYSNGSNVWVQAAPGATSGVQGYSAKLASLAGNATNGIIVQNASGTVVARSLVQPAEGITISNADGVSGNPTFALANDLAGIEGLTTNGFAVRTATDTWTTRDITGTSGRIAVSNGDGIASSPTIDLATVSQAASGNFVKVTLDSYGRVTGNTPVVTADITALVDATYVNVAGDTMTGNLVMSSGATVTGLPDPTNASDAANKNYVDSAVAGLSWKQSVLAASTGNLTLSGAQTVDGVALIAGDRVLVKDQTLPEENGIYVVASGAWTRGPNTDTAAELNGAAVFVTGGSTNDNSGWVQTADVVVLGTDPVIWQQFSGSSTYVAGIGLSLSGNTFNVNLGAGIAQLPSDEVGIDLYDPTGGALALTSNGTTRGTNTADKLYLILDSAGALAQTSAGLKVNAASVTNAMLVNDFITIDADTGTADNLQLGDTFIFVGDSAQGVSSVVTAGQVQYTVANATDLTKGVASFNSTSFTVTAGAVTLNTVDVAHGGTGATTFGTNQLLIGNGTSPVSTSADLTFVSGATDTLTIGGASGLTVAATGTDAVITSLATNGDLVLVPNGTGSVIVGPVGQGIIQSDTGTDLVVRGNDGLTLETGTSGQDIIMLMPSGTGTKVTISGPTASDYATSLAANDLTNKQYVDDAIASGATSGSIKAVKATVSLAADGTTNIGALLPAGATILSVKVNVTVVDTAATLSIGKTGSVAAYMTTGENDAQSTGLYLAETYVTEAGAVQVIATVASSAASSGASCNVIVQYQVA